MESMIANFQPLVNQVFIAKPDGHEIPLKLVEVESTGKPFRDGARQPFTLIFTSDISCGLMYQGTYVVENEVMGKKDIFLIPFSERDGKYHYQAIYN